MGGCEQHTVKDGVPNLASKEQRNTKPPFVNLIGV